MYVCCLNKNFDHLDELFTFTNRVFDIIAVSETRITKQTSLTTNTGLKRYTMQKLLADFPSERDCSCWDSLVKEYELSGNELIYLMF